MQYNTHIHPEAGLMKRCDMLSIEHKSRVITRFRATILFHGFTFCYSLFLVNILLLSCTYMYFVIYHLLIHLYT